MPNNSIEVLVPALNEEATVSNVVREFISHPAVNRVLVADNGSTDRTAIRARDAGAQVVDVQDRGYGHAFKEGLRHLKADWVFKVDADFRNPKREWVDLLMGAGKSTGARLVKTCWNPTNEDPDLVTNLTVRPLLARLYPGLRHLQSPLSGAYLFHRKTFPHSDLVPTFALDLQLLILAERMGLRVEQVEIESVYHGRRSLRYYFEMADELVDFLLRRAHH